MLRAVACRCTSRTPAFSLKTRIRNTKGDPSERSQDAPRKRVLDTALRTRGTNTRLPSRNYLRLASRASHKCRGPSAPFTGAWLPRKWPTGFLSHGSLRVISSCLLLCSGLWPRRPLLGSPDDDGVSCVTRQRLHLHTASGIDRSRGYGRPAKRLTSRNHTPVLESEGLAPTVLGPDKLIYSM